jgi:tRNA/tmRNA/rRNA uracil-C5-methylase (TrmA/RlmC/RlmD family)
MVTGLPIAPPRLPLRDGCEAHCPGCAHRALDAETSVARKEQWLHQPLALWQDRFSPLQAVAGEDRWGYRDKVCLTTVWDEGGWQFGLLARQMLIPIPRCPIHSPRVQAAIQALAPVLPPGPRFPLAYYVQSGGQAILLLKTARPPDLNWLDHTLQQRLADLALEGLWLHLHPSAGKRLFARHGWQLLWGAPRSRDDHGLWYGPAAFQQLLPTLYRQALAEAEDFLAPAAGERVVDLYCGTGSSLVRWLARGARVIAVELGGEAVACAQQNAPSARVLRGKCSHRIPQLADWLAETGECSGDCLLYANPPRTGLEPEVLTWIAERARPLRMAYLSCSAGTLRRDLDRLTAAGYEVAQITPYDFFPQTYHVETLVLLRRLAGAPPCARPQYPHPEATDGNHPVHPP